MKQMYSNVYQGQFGDIRSLMAKKEFQRAYDLLQKINNKCSEWYYLTGLSAMNIGYYDEGEEYIKTAATMEPKKMKNIVMHLINITNIETTIIITHITTIEEKEMIQMVVAAVVVVMTVVIHCVNYGALINVVNVVEAT